MFGQLRIEIGRRQGAVILGNVRVPATMVETPWSEAADGLVQCDIEIGNSRLQIKPQGETDASAPAYVDCSNRMVWALPVDAHTHIDKGQIWPRTKNLDGSFLGAMNAGDEGGGIYLGAEDLRARASFMLQCAAIHGTRAIRSHVDADKATIDTKMSVLVELAQDYAGIIDLQLAPFIGVGEDPVFMVLAAQLAATQPQGTLSAFLFNDPELESFVDAMVGLAERFGLSLDFHADETLDPDSHCLAAVAKSVLRHSFSGSVVVGHCCALSVQDDRTVGQTIELVAKAGIGIVALPLCNAYLQDRGANRSPRQRGVAPLKELKAAGVRTAIASDNVRDHFYAYGDLDMVELFRDAARFMQLDHPVGNWPAAISRDAAAMIGLGDLGRFRSGGPADLLMFQARNWSEFLARPQTDRMVMRGGKPQSRELPEFSQLDYLDKMSP